MASVVGREQDGKRVLHFRICELEIKDDTRISVGGAMRKPQVS